MAPSRNDDGLVFQIFFYMGEQYKLFKHVYVDLSDHSSQTSDQIATGYVSDETNIQSANLEQTKLLSMIRTMGQGKGTLGKGSTEASPLPACL